MYERYINELNEYSEEYKISIKDFREWLINKNMMESFQKEVKEVGLVKTAIDYSVMIATVKAVAI